MPVCIRCNKDVGLLGRLTFNNKTHRCGRCEAEVQQARVNFRNAFISACADGVITPLEWIQLRSRAASDRLDLNEALTYVRGDALHFIERTLSYAFSDGQISSDDENSIHQLIRDLAIPGDLAQPILSRLIYLKLISTIRRGELQTIRPSIHLDAGELCYMETDATYHKVNARSISYIPGRLIATNKRLHFLSQAGGAEIPLKRIMRIDREGAGIYLELSTKKANGHYDVNDPVLTEVIIDTLVRMDKRQLLAPQSDVASRHIPQEVKQAVWQRDQGKCVQCGATTYLEFDHIIPFSKGGASTVNNVQLLCRKCNLVKGGRL
jgi:uncharacterized protein (UPF0248 family)